MCRREYGCPSISQAVQSYLSKDRCSVYAKISTSKDSGISISTKYPRMSVAVSTQACPIAFPIKSINSSITGKMSISARTKFSRLPIDIRAPRSLVSNSTYSFQ